jgi:hypothetical protein
LQGMGDSYRLLEQGVPFTFARTFQTREGRRTIRGAALPRRRVQGDRARQLRQRGR